MNNGYTNEEAKDIISEIQKQNSKMVKNRFSPSKENYKKYGYSDDEIKEICLTPANIKFWLNKGYSEEEAILQISQLQRGHANKFSEKRKLFPELYSAITETQLGYWLNKGYSKEEAIEALSERQRTFTLEKCVQKYGKEEGIKVFTERQNKWQKSLNKNGNIRVGYSKTSQDLFYKLLDYYDIKDRENIFFATHNKEYRINKDGGGVWMYDFTDLKNKKIIEYNGDTYHANPTKYLPEDTPHPYRKNISANEIWKKDEQKIKQAEKEGFKVLVVWESECGEFFEDIIIKCVNFLQN